MTFEHLLEGAEFLSVSGNPDVSSVEYDSRRVKPGCAFVAMRGEIADGNRFIDHAIQAGAVAIITDSAAGESARRGGVGAGAAWTARAGAGERRISTSIRRKAGDHRHYGNERQEYDGIPDRSDLERRRTQERADWNDRISRGRTDVSRAAYHAGGARNWLACFTKRWRRAQPMR